MLEYIKEELAAELISGRLSIVNDPDALFARLGERFPIGLNRISWEKVAIRQRIEVVPVPRPIASDELRVMLSQHKADVQRWLDQAGVEPRTQVFWIGDSTDAALAMSRQDLVEFFPVLFSFPQHSYALPDDGSWVLNYVMEGELFFAEAEEDTTISRSQGRKR